MSRRYGSKNRAVASGGTKLSGEDVVTLRRLLGALGDGARAAATNATGPVEIGMDGKARRAGSGGVARGGSTKNKVCPKGTKRVVTWKHVPTDECKRVSDGEPAEHHDASTDVARVVRGLLGAVGGDASGERRISLRDGYLVIPLSLDDSED